ncbi:alanine racemase [Pseudoroseomonas globiformis]|uniref:Alanine racemase n=1 Tax=Teichococcus globiformis TaxID=2307229 RepID=A0ABV7FU41_9PROT
MELSLVETPTPVVELDIVEANLRRMQDYCDRAGIALRPHIKTHKIPALAHRQIELGARGITCQKLGEAEVMADAGIDDILISYPLVGVGKALRLAGLAQRATMRVSLDNRVALETVAEAGRIAGREIGVLVEFDSGNGRTGVTSIDEVLELARAAREMAGVRFDGLMNYPVNARTGEILRDLLPKMESEGLKPGIISGGGTPNAFRTHEMAPITELRVGTYIYNDRMTVAAGHASWDDCAYAVHVTVISRPRPDLAIIDAGSKVFSSDAMPPGTGDGHGYFPAYAGAKLVKMSEEHGMVDVSACGGEAPKVGERLRVIPNHVCPVSNLFDRLIFTKGGAFQTFMPIAARGRSQ